MQPLELSQEQAEFAVRVLGNMDFFQTMSEDEIRSLLPFLRVQGYAPGELVCRQGDPGDAMFVVWSGSVEAKAKAGLFGSKTLRRMRPGDFFGEIALLDQSPRTATVACCEVTELLVLTSADFELILERHPEIGAKVRETAARRKANG